MRLPDLQPLYDRGALYVQLRQHQFGDWLDARLGGDHRWDADLPSGTLVFTGPQGQVVTRCHFVASVAPGPKSLLWGWANPGDAVPGDAAARLLEYGEQHGIGSLTTPELPLATEVGETMEEAVAMAAHEVAAAAIAVTGLAPYYSAPAGGGTRVVMLLEGVDLPPLSIGPNTLTTLSSTLASGTVRDQRTSFHGLAELAGWRVHWEPGYGRGTVTDTAGQGLSAEFDQFGRLLSLSGSLSPGAMQA